MIDARSAKPDVVDLLSSDEEDVKKPAAKKRPPKRKSIVSLLSDSDIDSDDQESFESPLKRQRPTATSAQRSLRNSRASGTSRAVTSRSLTFDSLDRSASKANSTRVNYNSDLEFARKLQDEENKRAKSHRRQQQQDDYTSDIDFARKLQEEEDRRDRKIKIELEQKDAAMAATLHSEEVKDRDERKQKEFNSMKDSKAGRAVLLAEKVIELLKENTADGIEPVGKDDAVYLAEKMMELQEVFETENRPTHVSISYHYTNSANMDSIRTDGLLTLEDRVAAKNSNTRNIAFFGNGIYSGKVLSMLRFDNQ